MLCISRHWSQMDGVAVRGALWRKDRRQKGYVDLLRRPVSETFIRMTHDRYYEELAEHFGKTIVGFFDDEPAIGGAHDSPELFEAFADRYGYRLEDCLDHLFVPGRPKGYRVRADYWRLVGELFGAHMKRIDDWCREHHVDSTGHFLGEESPQQEVHSQAAVWPVRQHMSVPGLDLLGCQTMYEPVPARQLLERVQAYEPSGLALTTRVASATARYLGVPRVMVEAYGVMPYWVSPVDLTASTHWLTGMGSNLLNDNLLTLSFEGFRKRCLAGRHFTTPWWQHYRDFAEMAGRCSLMATAGTIPAQVGLLYPSLTAQCLKTVGSLAGEAPIRSRDAERMVQTNRVCQQAAEALVRAHWDWEILFEEIAQQGRVVHGGLRVRHATFPAVVIPAAHVLAEGVFIRLEELAASGGLLIFLGAAPSISIDSGFAVRSRTRQLLSLANVHLVEVGDDESWNQLLDRLVPLLSGSAEPSVKLEGVGHENILTTHRRLGKRSTFQFANMSSQTMEVRARVRCNAPLQLWHPDTGQRHALETQRQRQEQIFSLELAPWEGVFVVSSDADEPGLEPPPPRQFRAGHPRPHISSLTPIRACRVRAFQSPQWEIERRSPNATPMRRWVRLDPGDEGRSQAWADGSPDVEWAATVDERLPFSLDPTVSPLAWVKCVFRADTIPAGLAAVVDGEAYAEGYLNGARLPAPAAHALWDQANLCFDLQELAPPGWNVLAFRTPVSEYFHPRVGMSILGPDIVDPVVLIGEFSSSEDSLGQSELLPPRHQLRLGTWTTQGLSGYAGSITYRQTATFGADVGTVWLDLGEVQAVAEVRVNGRDAGRRGWPPYQFRVDSLLTAGENLFEITVTNSLGGLLKATGWHGFGGNAIAEPTSGLLGPVRIVEMEPEGNDT